jgi:hypothetical protein
MRKGDFDVFVKDVTEPHPDQPLLATAADEMPSAWTADGRLIFDGSNADGTYSLKLIDPSTAEKITVLSDAQVMRQSAVSPDGRWLAYTTGREGRAHVFVRPFPGPGAASRVTGAEGGAVAQFRRSGRELYYRRGPRDLIAAQWEERAGRLVLTAERVVTSATWSDATGTGTPFSLAPEGRIYALVTAQPPAAPHIRVRLNWQP